MNLIIWGTGNYSKNVVSYFDSIGDEIVGFTESKLKKNEFFNKPVYPSEALSEIDYDFILVACRAYKEVEQTVKDKMLDESKIIYLPISWIPVRVSSGTVQLDLNNVTTSTICTVTGIHFSHNGIYTNSKEIIEFFKKSNVKTEEYWKQQDSFNAKTAVNTIAVNQEKLLEEFVLPEIKKEDIICDYGCGSGEWSRYISRFCKQCDGYDVSEKMIRTAKQLSIESEISNVNFYCADARNALLNNEYSHILMMGLLTYIDDETELISILKLMRKSLRPGGMLVARDTLSYSVFDRMFFYRKNDNYVGVYWNLRKYENYFIEAGFELLVERYLWPYFTDPFDAGSRGFVFI